MQCIRRINMYKELIELNNSDEYPLHMPGHKRNSGFGQIKEVTDIDITEIIGYDDLYDPCGIIKEALDRATRLYNTKQTFFLVNGSTVGILTAIFATTNDSGNILLARNCHKSVYHAIEIRNLKADYIEPDQTDGIFDEIKPEQVKKCLESKKYEAVIITSPTYEGKVSDIRLIAEICHKYKTPLIVDEAHGAHLNFSGRFPESAVKYADIVVQSTHKTLPALTQTGLLHYNSEIVSRESVEKYLQIFQTSSPSYVLMSSIDECLRTMEENGEMVWDTFFDILSEFKENIKDIKHLKLLSTDDPCKVVISTKNTSISGPKLQKILLEEYHLQLEMASATYIIAILSCNDTKDGLERFAKAIVDIDNRITSNNQDKSEKCNIKHLLHTKAHDYIYIYPPGIPIAVPGQEISEKMLATISEYLDAGLKVRGL